MLLLNRNGLYDPLATMFDEMVRRGLMFAEVPQRITLCADMGELIAALGRLTGKKV